MHSSKLHTLAGLRAKESYSKNCGGAYQNGGKKITLCAGFRMPLRNG